jgi:hypothetical protein
LQQSDEKVIERQRHQNEPFEISDLSVQATNVLLGEKFNISKIPESRDWLKDLQFTIKNKSDKQITYFVYSLRFPQGVIHGGQLLNPMDVGVPPSPLRSITENKPLVINSEDTFKVALPDKELTLIKKVLSREGHDLADLTTVILRIEFIIYEDGMRWEGGHWYKPNLIEPGKYERIDQ